MAPKDDDRVVKLEEKVEHIEEKLDSLLLKFARYEGKLGGILMVLAALGACFKLFWTDIKNLFSP